MTNAKILVIDDEQNIIDLVTAYLNRENYEVHMTLDGPSVCKKIEPDPAKPELLVTVRGVGYRFEDEPL